MEKEYIKKFCRPQHEADIEYKEYCLNNRTWKDGALEKVRFIKETYESMPIDKTEFKGISHLEYSYHVINCRGKARAEVIERMVNYGWEYIGKCGKSCYFRRNKILLESEEELTYVRKIREKNLTKILAVRASIVALAVLAICFIVFARLFAIQLVLIPESDILFFLVRKVMILSIMICVIIALININKLRFTKNIYVNLNDTGIKYINYQPRNILLWNILVILMIVMILYRNFAYSENEYTKISRVSDDACYRINIGSDNTSAIIRVEFLYGVYDQTNKRMIDFSDKKFKDYKAKLYLEIIDSKTSKVYGYDYVDLEYDIGRIGRDNSTKSPSDITAWYAENNDKNADTIIAYIMIYDGTGKRIKFCAYADTRYENVLSNECYGTECIINLDRYKEHWNHEF